MNTDTGEVYEGEPRRPQDVRLDPFLMPREYLMRNQPSDPAVVDRIKKAALDKIERRKLKRVQS